MIIIKDLEEFDCWIVSNKIKGSNILPTPDSFPVYISIELIVGWFGNPDVRVCYYGYLDTNFPITKTIMDTM